MWVEQIDVRGFRRLSTMVELSPGLNLVYGKNEAGKSTLFDALVCGLFGFSRAERRGPESIQALSRPWAHPQHALQLVLRECSHRDAIRVEWSLGDHRVSVYDDVTGEDLSGAVGRVAGDVDLGPWLLGIEHAEFRDVCCLDQVTIKPVHGSENLKQALQASVASGPAEVGHEQAANLLRDFLRGAIGLDLRSMNAKPDGPLGRLTRERDVAVEQLGTARLEREQITALASALPDLRDLEASCEANEKRLTQRLLLSRHEVTSNRLELVRRKADESKDRPEGSPSLLDDQVSAIHRDRLRHEELEHELRQARSMAERHAPEVADLTSRRDSLVRERDSLETYAEMHRGAEDRLRSLQSQREQVAVRMAAPEAKPADVDPEMERFRAERERLRALASGGDTQTLWLAAAALVAVASLTIGALASPVGFAGLGIAVAIYLYGRRAGGREELSEALARYGASSLEELERRAEADSARVSEARAAVRLRREQDDRDERAVEEIDAELEDLLRDAYPDGQGASPGDRVAAYLGALEKNDAYTRLRAEAAEVESALRERSEVARAAAEKEGDREVVKRRLGASYEAVGIDASDLGAAAAALDVAEMDAAHHRERVRAASAAAVALSEILGEESIGDLEAKVETLRSELEQHRARHGRLVDPPADADVDAVQGEIDWARGALRDARAERNDLQREVARRDAESGDPATLEALIADLAPRIGRMEDARDAVELAQRELVEAASETYREFAPALRTALQRYLPKITADRYAEAFVDEELGIKVRAPETGEIVGTERLSRGTQDQIFLIERLEVAQMLDRTTGGAPLLLDDPFDRFDLERLRLGLEILDEVAQQRQVVLFSEDEYVVEAVKCACSDCKLIELPAPEAKAT